jgi:guanylate kinase
MVVEEVLEYRVVLGNTKHTILEDDRLNNGVAILLLFEWGFLVYCISQWAIDVVVFIKPQQRESACAS